MPNPFQIRPEGDTTSPAIRPGLPKSMEPTYDTWKRRLWASLARRDKFKTDVDIFIKEIRGERVIPWGVPEMWGYDFWVNFLFSNAKVFLGHVYHQNPVLLVKKTTQLATRLAPVVESAVNYYQRELNIKKVNQRAIVEGYLTNLGVIKVGYKAEFGQVPVPAVERDETDVGFTERILKKLGVGEDDSKKKDVEPEKFHEFVRDESPFVINVSPFDMLFPVGTKYIEEAQWVGQEITTFLSVVKGNPLYKNTEGIQGTHYIDRVRTTRSPTDPLATDEEFRIVKIYELYDLKNKKMLIIELNAPDFLYKADDPHPEMDGSPYVLLQPNIAPKEDIYGTPLPKIDESIRLEFVGIRQRVAAHIDKFVGRMAVNSDFVDEETMNNLLEGDMGSVVKVQGDDYRKALGPLPQPGLGAEVFEHLNRLSEELRITTLISEAKRGGQGQRKTLGEAQLIERGTNISLSIDQDDVDEFVKNQTRKLIQIIMTFVDHPLPLMVKGEGGLEERAIIPVEDIQTDLHFDVQVGSSSKPNPELNRVLAQQLFDFYAQPHVREALAAEGKAPVFEKFSNKLLTAFEESSPEEYLTDLPPPPLEGEEGEEGASSLQVLQGGQG